MGYQESFIKFKDKKTLIEELRKYKKNEHALAELVCVDRVKKDIEPFVKGELIAVVCGERSVQRSLQNLKDGLGIDAAERILPIEYVLDGREGDLNEILAEHFEVLSEEEFRVLLR